jgi:tetratricopeptide (TPR) repeat protein
MSLFVDVIPVLSEKIKAEFVAIIEKEKDGNERSVRKICDVCLKYLEYGELRYDRMEDAIGVLGEKPANNAFYEMLLGIFNESLDEDQTALKHLERFSNSHLAQTFRAELEDFMIIGKYATLKNFDMLEKSGGTIIEKYTNAENIAETITNLYFTAEDPEYLPVFERLIEKATSIYPDSMNLESASGYIHIMGKNYELALQSFSSVKSKLEQDKENRFYNRNMASIWNSIAGCYLKMGDADKTIESCDTALTYNDLTEDLQIKHTIFYNKAEALLMKGDRDQAKAIIHEVLAENAEEERAQEILSRI